MFEILRKSLATGVVTTSYPEAPAVISSNARGRPEIDFAQWKDARPAATICPTGAISCADCDGTRTATLDLGACIFCGLCAEVDTAIRMTNRCELAARRRGDLRTIAKYRLRPDGTHEAFLTKSAEQDEQGPSPSPPLEERAKAPARPAQQTSSNSSHAFRLGGAGIWRLSLSLPFVWRPIHNCSSGELRCPRRRTGRRKCKGPGRAWLCGSHRRRRK